MMRETTGAHIHIDTKAHDSTLIQIRGSDAQVKAVLSTLSELGVSREAFLVGICLWVLWGFV